MRGVDSTLGVVSFFFKADLLQHVWERDHRVEQFEEYLVVRGPEVRVRLVLRVGGIPQTLRPLFIPHV